MSEAVIHIEQGKPGSAPGTIEVSAELKSGEVVAGQHLHIPLNSSLTITLRVAQVLESKAHGVRFVLDCDDEEATELVIALNFEDELLRLS